MRTFIHEVVDELTHHVKNENFGSAWVILPSKRAGIQLRTVLENEIGGTFFCPRISTVDELIKWVVDAETIDPIQLLFEFYEVYKSSADEPEDFEQFMAWAPQLLADFNEIDRQLVDPADIFRNLSSIKDIEAWSFNSTELSEGQKRFLQFWEQIPDLYFGLRAKLDEQEIMSSGMAYRRAALEMENKVKAFPFDFVLVAGLNALSKSEQKVIKSLCRTVHCSVLWDVDCSYTENQNQEAGLFYRKFAKEWNWMKFAQPQNHWSEEKSVEVISCSSSIGQAKIARELLATEHANNGSNNTGLILADESLLHSVLENIPECVDAVNVTMGYPLRHSSIHSLINTILQIQKRYQDYNSSAIGYKELLEILDHPLLKGLESKWGLASSIRDWVEGHNLGFVGVKQLLESNIESVSEVLFLFERWTDPADCLERTFGRVKDIVVAASDNRVVLEELYQYERLITQVSLLAKGHEFANNAGVLLTLTRQLIGQQSLSYFGDPVVGLQVMGMLETRALDFETVILLSANEDILPKGRKENSFIPYDLKLYHDLPTFKEKDAIYAYYFYRLIQRCKKVYILYSNQNEGFSSGEQSRYITQLEYEFPSTTRRKFGNQLSRRAAQPTSVFKSENVQSSLQDLFASGLSPSAINTFINCPLDFYYLYILGINEPTQVEESVESSTFGTMIHNVLERLYTPWIGVPLTVAGVQNMLPRIKQELESEFKSEYSRLAKPRGKNLLTIDVAAQYIQRFLAQEMEMIKECSAPIIIQSLEQDLNKMLEIKVNDQIIPVKLRGKADRIDRIGPTLRVIDYKTGQTVSKDVNFKEVDELFSNEGKPKALQLLLYALMAKDQYSDCTYMVSGIYSLKSYKSGLLVAQQGNDFGISDQLLDSFEEELKHQIGIILDNSQPFVHREEARFCTLCN